MTLNSLVDSRFRLMYEGTLRSFSLSRLARELILVDEVTVMTLCVSISLAMMSERGKGLNSHFVSRSLMACCCCCSPTLVI